MVAFWASLVVLLASPLRDSPGVWPNSGELLTPARKGPAMSTQIIQGDARQTGLPDAFFHCVATSPPYFGLREYGDDDREIGDEPTPDEYIDEMCKVGREVWRVLRDDGTWWLNLGDSFASTTKGGGSSSHDVKCGVPSKNLLMIPQRVAIALQADGWIIRAQIPWVKATCMPESIRDRPTVAHEYVFLLAKSQRYFWDADAVRMPIAASSVAAFGENAAVLRNPNRRKWQTFPGETRRDEAPEHNGTGRCGHTSNGRNLRTSDFFHAGLDEYAAHLAHVRENGGLLLSPDGDPLALMVNPVPNKLAHFAMWPPRLVAPMIKASTSEKGCCPKCGAQWQRIVEKSGGPPNQRFANGLAGLDTHKTAHTSGTVAGGALAALYREHGYPTRKTLGFSPSCECLPPLEALPGYEPANPPPQSVIDAYAASKGLSPIPCRVLDPFAGSGTTMQVCEALGRDSWGVELMTKNIPIIGERLKEKLDPESMRPISKHRVADASPAQRSLF